MKALRYIQIFLYLTVCGGLELSPFELIDSIVRFSGFTLCDIFFSDYLRDAMPRDVFHSPAWGEWLSEIAAFQVAYLSC